MYERDHVHKIYHEDFVRSKPGTTPQTSKTIIPTNSSFIIVPIPMLHHYIPIPLLFERILAIIPTKYSEQILINLIFYNLFHSLPLNRIILSLTFANLKIDNHNFESIVSWKILKKMYKINISLIFLTNK